MDSPTEKTFVSRGGLKLAAALDAFKLDVRGFVCADFGCNVGGFTDCLLQSGSAKVYAVDTGYGALAWKLRKDARVVVMERTNALHAENPGATVDLVVMDLGWTKQVHAIPAALRWEPRWIVSLIKPHYEAAPGAGRRGILSEADSERVAGEVIAAMPGLGVEVIGHIRSPILGGAGKGRAGNMEFLALLRGNPGGSRAHLGA